jgi:hypothetical protein
MEWESATCCGVNLAFAVFGGVGFVFCKLQDRALTQNSPTGIVARRKVDSLQPASTPDTRWILCNRHRRLTQGGFSATGIVARRKVGIFRKLRGCGLGIQNFSECFRRGSGLLLPAYRIGGPERWRI